MPSARVIPEDVLDLKAPTKKFLCPLTANEYGIEFLSFVIQDYDTKKTIFEVSRDRPLPIDFSMHDAMDPDSLRKINYELSEDFLRLPNISTTLVFSVGQEPLSDFRMVERHYFRDQLIKSYARARALFAGGAARARRRAPRARRRPHAAGAAVARGGAGGLGAQGGRRGRRLSFVVTRRRLAGL